MLKPKIVICAHCGKLIYLEETNAYSVDTIPYDYSEVNFYLLTCKKCGQTAAYISEEEYKNLKKEVK